jgi:TolB protein
MLVFERGGDLYRMTIDGSETVRLTSTKAFEADPAVSSDGLTIAFTRGTAVRRDEVWVSDLQGGTQRRVTAARPSSVKYATTSDPAWSPDNRSIYFARAAQGPNDICGWIYRVASTGGGLRRVTKGIELDSGPAPTPDGTRIALSAGDCEPGSECCSLKVVDRTGKPTKDLARLRLPGAAFSPAWSPDGSMLAFEVRNVDTETSAIYVANRDGSGLKRITRKGLNGDAPAWSSDGEWIAFAAWTRSTGSDLYLIHPDGTGLQRITATTAKEHSPSWVPRG